MKQCEWVKPGRFYAFLSLLLVFSCLSTLVEAETAQPRFLTLPQEKINSVDLGERLETIAPQFRALQALKSEGSIIADRINALLGNGLFKTSMIWAARGVTATLSDQQVDLLRKEIPGLVIETLSHEAVPVSDPEPLVNFGSRSVPKWNLVVSGSAMLRAQRNLTGRGVLIGVLGPDVSINHSCLKGKISYMRKFGPPPSPSNSRGTEDLALLHPLGLLAGNNPANDMSLAPDVQLAVALLPNTKISANDVLEATQWLMEPSEGRVPAAILISVDFQTAAPRALREILRACRTANILPILPAGNRPERITGMAALPESFTVGALDQWKAWAMFSGQGPCVVDQMQITKPDCAEPGVSVFGPSLDDKGYRYGSGTLQAAAHFAGIWAQLRQARPMDEIPYVLDALATSALDLDTPGIDNKTGMGLFDPMAALNCLENPIPPATYTPIPY